MRSRSALSRSRSSCMCWCDPFVGGCCDSLPMLADRASSGSTYAASARHQVARQREHDAPLGRRARLRAPAARRCPRIGSKPGISHGATSSMKATSPSAPYAARHAWCLRRRRCSPVASNAAGSRVKWSGQHRLAREERRSSCHCSFATCCVRKTPPGRRMRRSPPGTIASWRLRTRSNDASAHGRDLAAARRGRRRRRAAAAGRGRRAR